MTKIGRLLKESKTKQNVLAKKAGITPAAVCYMVKRGIHNTRTAQKIGEILKVDAIFLLENLTK